MNIVATERETYAAMWQVEAYNTNSPGEALLPIFLDMARPTLPATVLDAGCGAGKGALALRSIGFDVALCDLTSAGLLPEVEVSGLFFVETPLWDPLEPLVGRRDWVYCCDVMEHIPPTFAMLVVSRLLEVSTRGVFLSISLMPDQFGVWVGKPLHQTIQSFTAWRDQLNEIGRVRECRDLLNAGIYLVEPKC